MGQSLKKFSPGNDEKTKKEIVQIIEQCYTDHFESGRDLEPTLANFYQAVCETVEEINKTFGNTQFRVPNAGHLKTSYEEQHRHSKEPLTREEFQKIFQNILIQDVGFTGLGATDILIYIFGVPLTALLIKQGLFPRVVPNELLIPGVTSATVFALAKLKEI